MYSFVESDEDISATFAEAVGGLVSTVAQNLRVRVSPLSDGVSISKVLSLGFAVRKRGSGVEVEMADLQSEETRDLLFLLTLPAVTAPTRFGLVEVALTYDSTACGGVARVMECATVIERVVFSRDCAIAIDARNPAVDLALNRVMTALALKTADQLGAEGQLEEARAVLVAETLRLANSRTREDEFTLMLVADVQTAIAGLKDRRTYASSGSKVMRMSSSAHYMQRCSPSPSIRSLDSYSTTPRSMMRDSFH